MQPDGGEKYLERAKEDARGIRVMVSSGEELTNLICYLCQQCVEKQIKHVISLYGDRVPRTHQIGQLIELMMEVAPVDCAPSDAVLDAADLLSSMEAYARYEGLGSTDHHLYAEAMMGVNDIADWLEANGYESVHVDRRFSRMSAQ